MQVQKNRFFIDQTKTGKNGNCLSACIASILNIPITEAWSLDDVPDDKDWFDDLHTWSQGRGYNCFVREKSKEFCIAIGSTDRGDIPHAVLAENGKVIFDPHPKKTGLTEIDYYIILSLKQRRT
jgi:hypothetical protein